MSTEEYAVEIDKFAERHFEKKFYKKYKRNWEVTLKALKKEFSRPDVLLSRSMGDLIVERGFVRICKMEFRISGTAQSRKASGNRCIVSINMDLKLVRILLIYHKDDLPKSGGETVNWKKLIKENFPEYGSIFK